MKEAGEGSAAGSTVLITGATGGLGRAAAVYLAQCGYRVFAAGRSAEKRAQIDALARERKLPLETLEMDVCSDSSVDCAVTETEARAGHIDVLINNAGVGYMAPMEEVRMDDLRRQFETNFFGVVRVTQRVLPGMRASKRAGRRIVNMSSIAGKFAWPLFGPYSSSKFALEGMSDALRVEVYPFGIDVVLIEPGYIPTGFQDTSAELSSKYGDADASPYARVIRGLRGQWKKTTSKAKDTPEDCARVILRALQDNPPKPRYTVTRRARVLSIARRLLSDRAIDKRTIRAMGLERR